MATMGLAAGVGLFTVRRMPESYQLLTVSLRFRERASLRPLAGARAIGGVSRLVLTAAERGGPTSSAGEESRQNIIPKSGAGLMASTCKKSVTAFISVCCAVRLYCRRPPISRGTKCERVPHSDDVPLASGDHNGCAGTGDNSLPALHTRHKSLFGFRKNRRTTKRPKLFFAEPASGSAWHQQQELLRSGVRRTESCVARGGS